MNFFRRKPAEGEKNGTNGSAPAAPVASQFALVENGAANKAYAVSGAPPITATNGSAPIPAAKPAPVVQPAAAPIVAVVAAPASVPAAVPPLAVPTSAASATNGAATPAILAAKASPPSVANGVAPVPASPVVVVEPKPSRLSPELARATALRIEGNPTATPVISVRDLKKIYQMGDVEVRALQGVDIDIFPGEITAIMGPSGSGKSTLMNIIGCLDVPSEGTYTLDGADVSRMNDDQLAEIRCHKIGFVFQSFNLLSRTTAVANVELPLIYSGVGAGERQKRAKAALDLVGLGARLDHKPNELSGGQQQRVAIARALINRPAMILADEPTGNLDSKTSVEIMELFQRLNVEQGITIVFVTHNAETADYCHRTIRVRDGLVEIDRRHRPVAGIYSDPAVVALAAPAKEGAA